eukprot:4722569-Ditylum_brightwellii.AAC.1
MDWNGTAGWRCSIASMRSSAALAAAYADDVFGMGTDVGNLPIWPDIPSVHSMRAPSDMYNGLLVYNDLGS